MVLSNEELITWRRDRKNANDELIARRRDRKNTNAREFIEKEGPNLKILQNDVVMNAFSPFLWSEIYTSEPYLYDLLSIYGGVDDETLAEFVDFSSKKWCPIPTIINVDNINQHTATMIDIVPESRLSAFQCVPDSVKKFLLRYEPFQLKSTEIRNKELIRDDLDLTTKLTILILMNVYHRWTYDYGDDDSDDEVVRTTTNFS